MLAATDRPAFREGFGPMPQGFDHFPFGNMNALRDRLASDAESETPRIAAVMVNQFRVKAVQNRCPRVSRMICASSVMKQAVW